MILHALSTGTLPDTVYAETLLSLTQRAAKAQEVACDAEKALETLKRTMNSPENYFNPSIEMHGRRAFDQFILQQIKTLQVQMLQPKIVQHELYRHLVDFKPINARAFHTAIDKLIAEKVCVLTNIRINEASLFVSSGGA